MLIHLSPRLYVQGVHPDACALIDLRIDALGLHIRNGRELVARRPYPNKRYLVACRKVGQKAINGIFIDTPRGAQEFTSVTRWAVETERIITHRTKYILRDNDFDATTETMHLWYSTCESLGGWSSRWHEMPKDATPANAQPRMDTLAASQGGARRVGEVQDTVSPDGWIIERNETCRLPTVERERLLGKWAAMDRLPLLEAAFHAKL